MKTIRVFPRRTNATPIDELAYIGGPDMFVQADRVHISVTFTYDMPEAERIYKLWKQIAPTEIGGPATGAAGGDFVPGMYLKKGYVITSRGCPNRCWFCGVWRREGETVRELPVTEGFNILDDNLLACSEKHIRAVFAMLAKQKTRPLFTGGLEAARLKSWHIEEFIKLNPSEVFFAYDTPNDLEPLIQAGKMFHESAFSRQSYKLRCYALIGYPGDTFDAALIRLNQTMEAGFMPMAMLYRDSKGGRDPAWARFQREWARPAIIYQRYKKWQFLTGRKQTKETV